MSSKIEIAVTGNLARSPHRVVAGESILAEMRIASTRRYFHRTKQEFVDAPTSWFTVKAWGELGENVLGSNFDRGVPLVVRGELRTEEWTAENGEPRSKQVIHATSIGPDLNRGTAPFTRTIRQSAANEDADGASEDISATAARMAAAPEGAPHEPAAELSESPQTAEGLDDSQWESEATPVAS